MRMFHSGAETSALGKGVDCGAQLPNACFLSAARKQAITGTPAPTASLGTRSLAILSLLSTMNAHNMLHAPLVSKTRRKSLSLRRPNTLSSPPHCLTLPRGRSSVACTMNLDTKSQKLWGGEFNVFASPADIKKKRYFPMFQNSPGRNSGIGR
jgi:hypothetical protein